MHLGIMLSLTKLIIFNRPSGLATVPAALEQISESIIISTYYHKIEGFNLSAIRSKICLCMKPCAQRETCYWSPETVAIRLSRLKLLAIILTGLNWSRRVCGVLWGVAESSYLEVCTGHTWGIWRYPGAWHRYHPLCGVAVPRNLHRVTRTWKGNSMKFIA